MAEHEAKWFFSRSDAELYDKCPRARFHRTIGHTGRGLVRVGSNFDQTLGRIVHRAAEAILTQEMGVHHAAAKARQDISHYLVNGGQFPTKVPVESHEQFAREAESLAEGLIWAWETTILPGLLASYNILQVEQQTQIEANGMVLPCVADVVLESKDDGTLIYPDWKTTKFVNAQWMEQWNRKAQLHTTARAVEQTLRREVEYCYVQALVKGRWQKGYQQSPLVWGYAKGDAGPGDEEFQYKYTSRKGYRRVPVWQVCSMERWVKEMPLDLRLGLVPRTQPITVDPELADTWWRQRVIKERNIRSAKIYLEAIADTGGSPEEEQSIMDSVFPQSFDQCAPMMGYRCDFYEMCHDPHGIGANPIASGVFRRRPTYQERLAEEGGA